MRKKMLFAGLCALLTFCTSIAGYAQVSVTSSNGYTVHITVQPVSIVPSSASCPFGYNYNVNLHYIVTFTGSNIPASLYTLQGTLGCGANSHFYDLPNNGGTGNVTSVSNVWNPNSDCATATPASLLCNTASVQIEGLGITAQTLNFSITSGGPLAISLADFTAEAIKEKVKLNWSTVSEINNDYFSVERSTDGSSWTVLKTIKGTANSSTLVNYEWMDEKPVVGNLYYRLKQTDLDGKFSYSVTRLIKYTAGDNIYAYPVPNTGNTVNFKGIVHPENIQLSLLNAAGALTYRTTLTTNAAELPLIKPGIYTISLFNKLSGETTNLRYVKL
ncbi:hypothetical protein [Ferruginibacter sp. SUN106]|uniref:hypothetical protein n=1 Tax=Ferruginibacter sp. SUN106 TaxID=2978348 RepID=UPI003D37004B